MRNFLVIIVAATIIGICSFFAWNAVKAGKEIDLSKVKLQEGAEIKADPAEGQFLYEVKNGEAEVKDMLIDRFTVGSNVSVTYRNTTEESLEPAYSIRLYNSYGLLVGQEKVNSESLEPGEVGAHNIPFSRYPVNEILANSRVSVGDNVDKIKWIIVYETNTKVSE